MHSRDLAAADVHMHTTASDGTASPRQVLDWVRDRTDLSVIAITDHNTVEGALEAAAIADAGDYPFDVIVGQEVESTEGHVIGLWAPEPVRPDMTAAETVEAIHAQGGLALAAHPFAPRWWHRHGLPRGSVATYNAVPFDGFETANSTPLLGLANRYARLYWLANRERLARTGGSDAHILAAIGSSRTLFPGETAGDLRRAIEERTTVVRGPGVSATRGLRYARRAPEIKRRSRDHKERQRETSDGAWGAPDPTSPVHRPGGRDVIASIVRVAMSVISGGALYAVWLAVVLSTMRRPTAPLPLEIILTAPIVIALGLTLGALLGDLLTNRPGRRFLPVSLPLLAACAAGALVVYPFGPMLIVLGTFAAGTAVAMFSEARSHR